MLIIRMVLIIGKLPSESVKDKIMTTLIGTQREIMQKAFDELGGLAELVKWAQEVDEKGNKSNYREFIKLFVKLVPPVKPATKDDTENQESFIMRLMREEQLLIANKGKPVKLIDVDAIES